MNYPHNSTSLSQLKATEFHYSPSYVKMLNNKAIKRIQKELTVYKQNPPMFAEKIYVDETDMRKVYFLIRGPTQTPYENGEYILYMHLADEYPFKAPTFKMTTPNGRFTINTPICLSGLSAHHSDTWSPNLTFSTLVIAFISFFTDEKEFHHIGALNASTPQKLKFAIESKAYNIRNNNNIVTNLNQCTSELQSEPTNASKEN